MANISGSYDEHAETQTSFDPIPAGEYRAVLIDAEVDEISKRADMGRCLKLTWKIETGPHDGRLVWQRLNLWAKEMKNLDQVIQIANSQFASIRQATGITAPQDTDELLHIPCAIRVGIRHSEGYDPQNEVKSVKAVGGNAPASSQQPATRSAPPVTQKATVAAQAQQQASGGSGGKMPWN